MLFRSLITTTDHPELGPVRTIAPPIRLSETPTSIREPAPLLGQHTAEVLHSLGYSADEIDALTRSGAAGVPDRSSIG